MKPTRPATVTFDAEEYDHIKELANEHGRSLANFVRYCVRMYLLSRVKAVRETEKR